MLVLSRRPHQSINFPTLGVSVQILRVAGQTVRVGVEAPRSVPVRREELPPPPGGHHFEPTDRRLRHELRGRLNGATMALYLAQRQIQLGRPEEGQETLQKALEDLTQLERSLTPPAARKERRPVRALLVEDNPHERVLLESYLKLSGMEVDNVSDGEEALSYLSTRSLPDAVLLDMRMPRRDGPATVAAIRGNPKYSRLKIYAVSGAPREEVGLPTGPEGVDDWFPKPLNPARLVDALASIA